MRALRASEIGAYLYCHRAWWYQLQGIESENQAEMAAGGSFHHAQGAKVLTGTLLRAAGWILLLAAIVIVAVAVTMYFLT